VPIKTQQESRASTQLGSFVARTFFQSIYSFQKVSNREVNFFVKHIWRAKVISQQMYSNSPFLYSSHSCIGIVSQTILPGQHYVHTQRVSDGENFLFTLGGIRSSKMPPMFLFACPPCESSLPTADSQRGEVPQGIWGIRRSIRRTFDFNFFETTCYNILTTLMIAVYKYRAHCSPS